MNIIKNRPFKPGDILVPVLSIDGRPPEQFEHEYPPFTVKRLNVCSTVSCHDKERECLSGKIGVVDTKEYLWCISYNTKPEFRRKHSNVIWRVIPIEEYERAKKNSTLYRVIHCSQESSDK